MKTQKILFSWLGNNDLNDVQIEKDKHFGAISSILAWPEINFDKIYILSNREGENINSYIEWLKSKFAIQVEVLFFTENSNPTDYYFIYSKAEDVVNKFGQENSELFFNITSGTSTMSATWLLLGTAIYNATLLQSSRERGVEYVNLPYNISLQDKQDKKIAEFNSDLNVLDGFREIPAFSEKMREALRVGQLISPRNIPVLIQGKTGTGKEVMAQAIHKSSPRKDKSFIAVNCGAIPDSLIDSELFGHKKGAFTGAESNRKGHFESAHEGTLFLDEVGELSLAAQVKLLRVLQQKEIVRLGESKPIKIDVRIIAATHRDLIKMVESGTFREDLFYRLAIGLIHIPSLKERPEDILPLSKELLDKINNDFSDETFCRKELSEDAKSFIQKQIWLGNVRELGNTLLRAAIWNPSIKTLTSKHIANAMTPQQNNAAVTADLQTLPIDLPHHIKQLKRRYAEAALIQTHMNKIKAAKLLGLNNSQTLDSYLNS